MDGSVIHPPQPIHPFPSTRPRNLQLGNRIVQRTLEIIQYLQPDVWFMENPQTGLLKDQPYMEGRAFVDVDYRRFSNWGYKKRTRVWYGGKHLSRSEPRSPRSEGLSPACTAPEPIVSRCAVSEPPERRDHASLHATELQPWTAHRRSQPEVPGPVQGIQQVPPAC